MKKTNSIIVVLGCLLFLGGCGTSDTGQVKAYTIADGNIAGISIGDNEETPEKGGVAIAQLPKEIVAVQAYNVDAVTGATVTSDGIKDAVAKCLEKASEQP